MQVNTITNYKNKPTFGYMHIPYETSKFLKETLTSAQYKAVNKLHTDMYNTKYVNLTLEKASGNKKLDIVLETQRIGLHTNIFNSASHDGIISSRFPCVRSNIKTFFGKPSIDIGFPNPISLCFPTQKEAEQAEIILKKSLGFINHDNFTRILYAFKTAKLIEKSETYKHSEEFSKHVKTLVYGKSRNYFG